MYLRRIGFVVGALAIIVLMHSCEGLVFNNLSADEQDDARLRKISVSPGDTINLQHNMPYYLSGIDFKIEFDSILTDSRCPKNANCVWEGYAQLHITASNANGDEESTNINTNEDIIFSLAGQKFKFLELLPYPINADSVIQPEQYKLKLLLLTAHDNIGWVHGVMKDYTGLDGCRWVIEAEDGSVYEPIIHDSLNFEPEDDMAVSFKFVPATDMASICMVGQIIQITAIKAGGICGNIRQLGLHQPIQDFESDPFHIDTAFIAGNNLNIVVGYSGCAKDHIFKLSARPLFCGTPPLPPLYLILQHDDLGQLCKAYFMDTLCFELNSIHLQHNYPSVVIQDPKSSASIEIKL